jgi:hypothetical protein
VKPSPKRRIEINITDPQVRNLLHPGSRIVEEHEKRSIPECEAALPE